MTSKDIKTQIEIIKDATKKASVSKQTAIAFLKRAKIIKK